MNEWTRAGMEKYDEMWLSGWRRLPPCTGTSFISPMGTSSTKTGTGLRASSGNTTMDRVTLRQRHAMADLFYFERPRNLSLNRPFFLDIHPKKGWEIPIRLRIVLN